MSKDRRIGKRFARPVPGELLLELIVWEVSVDLLSRAPQ